MSTDCRRVSCNPGYVCFPPSSLSRTLVWILASITLTPRIAMPRRPGVGRGGAVLAIYAPPPWESLALP